MRETLCVLKLARPSREAAAHDWSWHISGRNGHNRSKCHNYTIRVDNVALSSQLTIDDALISLERFGEAKDEGLTGCSSEGASARRFFRTGEVCIGSGAKMLARTQSECFPAGRCVVSSVSKNGLHAVAGLREERLVAYPQA